MKWYHWLGIGAVVYLTRGTWLPIVQKVAANAHVPGVDSIAYQETLKATLAKIIPIPSEWTYTSDTYQKETPAFKDLPTLPAGAVWVHRVTSGEGVGYWPLTLLPPVSPANTISTIVSAVGWARATNVDLKVTSAFKYLPIPSSGRPEVDPVPVISLQAALKANPGYRLARVMVDNGIGTTIAVDGFFVHTASAGKGEWCATVRQVGMV